MFTRNPRGPILFSDTCPFCNRRRRCEPLVFSDPVSKVYIRTVGRQDDRPHPGRGPVTLLRGLGVKESERGDTDSTKDQRTVYWPRKSDPQDRAEGERGRTRVVRTKVGDWNLTTSAMEPGRVSASRNRTGSYPTREPSNGSVSNRGRERRNVTGGREEEWVNHSSR